MLPDIYFKDEEVLALTSDASVDFSTVDFDSPLTQEQRAYLRTHSAFDIPKVFWRRQAHGDGILRVKGDPSDLRGVAEADGFITDEAKMPLAIRTADCVPIFVFDPRQRVIALSHAGWRGTHQLIAEKTVAAIRETYNSQPADLKVVLGPGIRECCYQVAQDFMELFPGFIRERREGLYLDIMGANREQLAQVGVRRENITDTGRCTCCDKNYFSFRRDGAKAGRMISLMMLL